MTEEAPSTPPPDQQEAENVEIEPKVEVKEEQPPETPAKEASSISAAHVESQYVRLRGLPYNASENDVKDFFSGLSIERVKFVMNMGRPNGEAYVEFKTKQDAAQAMEFDRKEMNKRYIEVFTISANDAESAFHQEPQVSGDENYVVRLRGLPWSCKESDIHQFFDGLEPPAAEIVIGGTGGPRSRPSGEAFVRFATAEGAQKAMEYNKRHLGSRYVEVFQSTMVELNREKGFSGGASQGPPPSSYERSGIRPLMSLDRSDSAYSGGSSGGGGNSYGGGGSYGGGYDNHQRSYGSGGGGGSDYYGGGGGSGYDQGYGGDYGNQGGDPLRIYMRGLPYDADSYAVESFFTPIRCHSVKLGINESGRPSGDAIAEFDNYNDMVSGMARNNQRMGRRYVELFYARDAPGPMRRLLWKDASGPNASGAPQPDPLLSGRRSGGLSAPPPRDAYRGPPRDSWTQQQQPQQQQPPRQRYDSGRGGAPRAPRAEPWGSSYGSGAPAAQPQYQEYGNGWDAYGYGAGAQQQAQQHQNPSAGAYPAAAYDRQRESRDVASSWTSQPSYGGWGAGSDQHQHRGGY